MGLPDFTGWEPATKKCRIPLCKSKGWFGCRGTCGNGYCGHHARAPIPWHDKRFSSDLRGTCVCHNCVK